MAPTFLLQLLKKPKTSKYQPNQLSLCGEMDIQQTSYLLKGDKLLITNDIL